MYPGFIAEYEDRSGINQLPITEVRNMPLYCTVFTSDKGTEAWTRISGKDFFKMYGENISFKRHGQPLLQAAMSINSGAELLCKRLVADDATLANMGIVATIADDTVEVQKKDASGKLLYLDSEGNETIEVTEKPAMTTKDVKKVSYSIKSAPSATTLNEAAELIDKSMHNADGVKNNENEYLLYVITDNGRGTSKKRIKITPNYKVSKTMDYALYTLQVLEGSVEVESMTFSANHALIVNDVNISLQGMINTNSTQLQCIEYPDQLDAFAEALADATGDDTIDIATMYKNDILFAATNRGTTLSENIIVDSENGINLQYEYGQMLAGGSNGTFGDYPISIISINGTDEYTAQAINAFSGSFDTVIFNLDQFKIDAIIDANYPDAVKREIERLANFREDFMYFRDQGLNVTTLDKIKDICKEYPKEANSMFCATYPQSYDIIDPYTKRQISVTIGYDIAIKLVQHINNGRILPTAGMKYNMSIDNAIYGTLSFSPVICPTVNQKEILEDLRVNYASYIDNRLVIEALYTSQEKYSQWSFVNNVMGIQEVVKAIRTRCPAIRYTFFEGEDLEAYKADVEEVIAAYRSNFNTLTLEYVQDATYSTNKIFYAVLKVQYKDFIQTEMIKVVALSTEEIES